MTTPSEGAGSSNAGAFLREFDDIVRVRPESASSGRAFLELPIDGRQEIVFGGKGEAEPARCQRVLCELARRGLLNGTRVSAALQEASPTERERIERQQQDVARVARALDVDLHTIEGLSADEAVAALEQAFRDEAGPCDDVTNLTSVSSYDAMKREITVKAAARVKRPLAQFASIIDARCWADNSPVFLESVAVDRGAGGGRVEDLYGRYHRIKRSEKQGTPWKGLLYEKIDVGGVYYENVLHIDFEPTRTGIRLDYRLEAALRPVNGVLEKDFGYITATGVGVDSTDLAVVKTCWFDDLTASGGPWDLGELPNYLAPGALALWLNDAAGLGLCPRHGAGRRRP